MLTRGLAAGLAVFTCVNGSLQVFPVVDSDGSLKVYGVAVGTFDGPSDGRCEAGAGPQGA
ncbi:MAG TPA: hypothetical protein VGA37_05725 [Gemmatimonadales bacterium]